jgi:hypothetical protein
VEEGMVHEEWLFACSEPFYYGGRQLLPEPHGRRQEDGWLAHHPIAAHPLRIFLSYLA